MPEVMDRREEGSFSTPLLELLPSALGDQAGPILAIAPRAHPKDRSPDANHRRALLDGELKISAHPHREALDARMDLARLIAERAERLETFSHLLEIVAEDRERHQAAGF